MARVTGHQISRLLGVELRAWCRQEHTPPLPAPPRTAGSWRELCGNRVPRFSLAPDSPPSCSILPLCLHPTTCPVLPAALAACCPWDTQLTGGTCTLTRSYVTSILELGLRDGEWSPSRRPAAVRRVTRTLRPGPSSARETTASVIDWSRLPQAAVRRRQSPCHTPVTVGATPCEK